MEFLQVLRRRVTRSDSSGIYNKKMFKEDNLRLPFTV